MVFSYILESEKHGGLCSSHLSDAMDYFVYIFKSLLLLLQQS